MSEEQKQEEVKQEEVQQDASAQGAKDKKPPKVEIPKSCGACKKPISKMRYYRNMQFFCNTKCWKTFKKKQDQEKQKAAEEAAAAAAQQPAA